MLKRLKICEGYLSIQYTQLEASKNECLIKWELRRFRIIIKKHQSFLNPLEMVERLFCFIMLSDIPSDEIPRTLFFRKGSLLCDMNKSHEPMKRRLRYLIHF